MGTGSSSSSYISRRGGGKGDLPQSLALTCAAWCYTNTHTLLIHAAAQLRQCRRCAHTFDTCINSGAAHWFPLILPVVGSVFVRSLVDSRNATRRHSSAGRHTSFTFVLYVLAECLSIVFYYTSSWIVSIRFLMASNCCNLLRSARSYVQHLRLLRIFRSLQTQHRSIIWIGSFVRNTKCVVDSSSSWKIFSKQLQQRERRLIWRGQALYIKLTFNLITNGNDCYT